MRTRYQGKGISRCRQSALPQCIPCIRDSLLPFDRLQARDTLLSTSRFKLQAGVSLPVQRLSAPIDTPQRLATESIEYFLDRKSVWIPLG
jgi:hypothetical protein